MGKVYTDILEEYPNISEFDASLQNLPDGYIEWQFQEAFESLCEKFGGRERGREEAKRLIEEMEQ